MTVVHDHSELASKTQDGFKAKSKSQLLIALVEWKKKKSKNAGGLAQKHMSNWRWDGSCVFTILVTSDWIHSDGRALP